MGEKIVTVFGSGRTEPGGPVYELALRLGRLLAHAGFTIANGGYGGTMEACARGAADAGGKSIGVTCSAFGRSGPNRYISREIVTGSLDERLNKLIELGRAYVVLPGGTGTLLELAKVWELKNKGFLDKARPIILLGRFWEPLVELVERDDPTSGRALLRTESPEQARDMLIESI